VVSSGAQKITVPRVEGLNEQNARSAIEGVGLKVHVQDQQVTNANQDGIVLTQSPSPQSSAEAGDTVTIYVGRFRDPENPGGGTG
jgi:serine/threonine-protein kinase